VLLKLLISNLFVFILFGCATSAPELPPDYNSVDSELQLSASLFRIEDIVRDCQSLLFEKSELSEIRKKIDEVDIQGRGRDQVLGFMAVLTFWPALVVAGNNGDLEGKIKSIQKRSDEINLLIKYKGCIRGS